MRGGRAQLGGLLAQLLAARHPELVCGPVLVDPAHPDMLAGLPRPVRRLCRSAAEHLPSLPCTLGLLEPVIGRAARRTAARFSDDPRTRSLVAAAYRTHARRSQVQASRAELREIAASAPLLRQARAASPLPDVPVVVLSAARGFCPGGGGAGPCCRPALSPRPAAAVVGTSSSRTPATPSTTIGLTWSPRRSWRWSRRPGGHRATQRSRPRPWGPTRDRRARSDVPVRVDQNHTTQTTTDSHQA